MENNITVHKSKYMYENFLKLKEGRCTTKCKSQMYV